MRMPAFIATGLFFAVSCQMSAGQQPAQPTDEHAWLRKFVGTWDIKSRSEPQGNIPAMESQGTIKSEMLGGFWVQNRMQATVAGFSFQGIQTIGYDPKKKKHIGTWVDSTNSFQWHYVGTVDKSGRKITLEADGPSMTEPGKIAKYRDACEFTEEGK